MKPCLFVIGIGVASRYAISREFEEAGEMESQRANFTRSGLRVSCSMRGDMTFDFSEKADGFCA
jgi:hypothetical protein